MTEQCNGFTCPVEATISLIGGKYKAVILWHLMNNTLRYSELHRKMPKATDKTLAPILDALCDWGENYLSETQNCKENCQ